MPTYYSEAYSHRRYLRLLHLVIYILHMNIPLSVNCQQKSVGWFHWSVCVRVSVCARAHLPLVTFSAQLCIILCIISNPTVADNWDLVQVLHSQLPDALRLVNSDTVSML